jgi:hypothetical protein
VLTENQKDEDQGDDEIKKESVPGLMSGQAMVIVDDQQQGAGNGDGDYFPVEVETGAEEGFHVVSSNQYPVISDQYGK